MQTPSQPKDLPVARKDKAKISAYVDCNNKVWKRIIFNNKIEWEEIIPIAGCVAVYEGGNPMGQTFIEVTEKELHDYVYKAKDFSYHHLFI